MENPWTDEENQQVADLLNSIKMYLQIYDIDTVMLVYNRLEYFVGDHYASGFIYTFF